MFLPSTDCAGLIVKLGKEETEKHSPFFFYKFEMDK